MATGQEGNAFDVPQTDRTSILMCERDVVWLNLKNNRKHVDKTRKLEMKKTQSWCAVLDVHTALPSMWKGPGFLSQKGSSSSSTGC